MLLLVLAGHCCLQPPPSVDLAELLHINMQESSGPLTLVTACGLLESADVFSDDADHTRPSGQVIADQNPPPSAARHPSRPKSGAGRIADAAGRPPPQPPIPTSPFAGTSEVEMITRATRRRPFPEIVEPIGRQLDGRLLSPSRRQRSGVYPQSLAR